MRLHENGTRLFQQFPTIKDSYKTGLTLNGLLMEGLSRDTLLQSAQPWLTYGNSADQLGGDAAVRLQESNECIVSFT